MRGLGSVLALRLGAGGLVLALLGGALHSAPAVGEPAQSSSSAKLELAFAAGAEVPSPEGGALGAEDGLAPGDGLGGPELGEAVSELGVLDLVGPDGVWTMNDGGREVPLRLLDEAEVAELGDALSLAASSAASAYAPGAVGNASGASASGAGAAAKPDTWFVSGTGQPHLLVGGVVVLFVSHADGPAIEGVWGRHNIASGRVSPLGELPNGFLVKTVSDAESLRLADALSAEPDVDTAVPNTFTPFERGQQDPSDASQDCSVVYHGCIWHTADARSRCNAYTDPWPDELSSCQWHLDASGDYRFSPYWVPVQVSDPRIDINIGDVWSTTMGAGVTVAVVDMTWNPNHEDLVDNVDNARSGLCRRTYRESITHGTAVAGVVGARDNAVGGRGVAPRATLVNYNLLDCYSSARKVEALTLNKATVAVANHSYGERPTRGLAPADSIYQRALETSLGDGFGGKGTSHVTSAGNGRESAHPGRYWSALDAANNLRGVVTVCAVNSAGTLAGFSEEGPSLWVCGLARERGQAGILAPVSQNHYTTHFGGTSAAAPMVSGVIALMRSVNAELTWRDVKVILADTAQKVDPQHSSWLSGVQKYSSTAETYSFSHRYGFGLVDAEAAVDAAAAWTLLPPMQTFAASHTGDVSLPGRGAEIELTLDLQTGIDFTEHVKVTVAGDISDFRDYRWTLVSPSGAESLLAPEDSGCLAGRCSLRGSFDFGSSRHLGENPRGTWKLRIQHIPTWPNCGSQYVQRKYCGTGFGEVVSSWEIEVTGHSSVPTEPVSLSVSAANVAEGGSVDVAVSVGGPAPTEDLVVPLAFAGVTAEAGADYSAPASVTVPAGSSSATAHISIAQDTVHEGLETFGVRLGTLPLGYHPESGLVVVAIADDDPLPVLSLHAASSVAEGGSVAVTARLSGLSSEDVTATLAAAAVAPAQPSDGWLGSPAVLRVPAGSTESSGSVVFAASQNDVYELSGSAAKTFEVSATAGGNGVADPDAITVRIDDDDPVPSISIAAGPAVAEGAAAKFTLTASPTPSADLAVSVTVAQQGAFGVTTGVRMVTIPASGRAVLVVGTTGDSAAEPDGSVTVTVAAGADYTPPPGSASVAVFDDDSPRPRVSVAGGPAVVEGAAAEFTLTAFPRPSADLAVSVTVAQRGAFGVVTGSRSVTVPVSGRVVLSVATAGDSFGEPDGSVTVALVDGLDYDLAAAATATVVVADDDGGAVPVAVSLSAGDASVSENGGATDFEISLSRALVAGETVSVPITVTGTSGSDWLLGDPAGPGVTRTGYGSTTAVEFTAGGRTAVMRFEAIDDDAEFDRPITFAFGTGDRAPTHSGVAGVLELGGPVTVTIADNDLPPVCDGRPTVSVADATALRGEDLEFRVTLSCRFSRALVAHYYIGRGSDIDGSTRSVTFGPGDTSAMVRVPTKDSDKVKFQVAYAPGAANALSVPAATGAVTEALPVVSIAADGGNITEGAAARFIITVVPAPASPIAVTMDIAQSGDYAYRPGQRTLVMSNGTAVYSVATRDDAVDEPDGSVTATLVDGAGYDVGTSSAATVIVADDDDPAPQVDITAGSGGTEGTDVVFTITATPQPAANLDVAVAITASGDYGVATGTRTATISSGTTQATLTIATTDDGDDEPDGSITAALVAGSGYTVGPSSSKTAPIADDDDPAPVIPEISVTAGGDVIEGSGAVFTVTASPPKSAAFEVSVTVSASGEWGVAAGSRTVSFAADAATATLTVPTVGDSVDEADGSVTATLDAPGADAGYEVSSAQGEATVAVSDDDVDPLTVYMIFFSRSIAEDGTGYDNQAQLNIAPTRVLRSWETLTVPLSVTGGDEGTHWTMRDLNDPDAVFANEFEVTFGPGVDGVVLEPGDQRVELVLTAVDDSDWDDQEITVWYGTGSRAPSLNGSTEGVTLGISWGPDGVERADGSTTVVIIDSDEPPPEVTITAATGGTEGTDATFTITASAPVATDLDVSVDIASSGDWGATTGSRTATIPKGATQATLTVATVDDSADEADGSITATLRAGSGYEIGRQAAQTAQILDDDDPPPEPAIAACTGKPTVTVADAAARQGEDLQFEISLSCRSTGDVTVYYAVAHDRRLGNVITITIKGGETGATVNVPTAGIDADIEFHIVYLIGAANNTAKATATITP